MSYKLEFQKSKPSRKHFPKKLLEVATSKSYIGKYQLHILRSAVWVYPPLYGPNRTI